MPAGDRTPETVSRVNPSRVHKAAWIALILISGSVLAVAWWDWSYPGVTTLWWRGERVYGFYWLRLLWALLTAEGICLGLWVLSARAQQNRHQGLRHAAWPFGLSFLALLIFARYKLGTFGVQPGSAVWTYWLIGVTAAVLAFPLYRVWRTSGLSTALQRWGWHILCGLVAIYVCVFGLLSVTRHNAFRTHALDLGTMDQAAWNTIHGRVLERTPLYRDPASGSRYENRLLDAKMELIFIPLSALYWLWSDPRVLLLVQTVFLGASAIPLYLLVRGRTQDALLATSVAAAYLCYLPLHYVNMADFHPSALMVPFLLAAWHTMRQRRWRQYYLWLALALSCRIDAAFVALSLGAVIGMWQKGARRHGVYTVLLSIAWLAADFWLVVPSVRQVYGPGAGDLVSRRFGALGGGPLDVLHTLVTQPGSVLAQFVDREKAQVIFDLLVPSGLASLFAPLALLPALPILAINLLAESTWQHSIQAHYMAPVIPFVWIAAGEGIGWLARARSRRWAGLVSVHVLLTTLLVSWAFSPFPLGRAFRLADAYQPSAYERNLRAVIARIPEGASVCAQSDLYAHLSQRRDAALFPRCRLEDQEETAYVVVDLDPTSVKSPLDYHAFYESVAAWLAREDYGVTALQGGALLLQRGATGEDPADVQRALAAYGASMYRVEFLRGGALPELQAGTYIRVPVVLRNAGAQSWHSRGQLPVRLAYRWLTKAGAPVLSVPALRTDLPHRVAPGKTARLHAALLMPSEPGTYLLEWDVVREGDAWFSDMGGATLLQAVTIR